MWISWEILPVPKNYFELRRLLNYGKSNYGELSVFNKILKLEKGAIKPLQCKKTLKVLIKSVKEFTGINFNISSNKPKAWSLLLHRCLKKFQKTFQRTSKWLLSNYDFFLKVSELNIKLDEPSLKEWIHLWIPVTFRSSFYWYLCKKSFLKLLIWSS